MKLLFAAILSAAVALASPASAEVVERGADHFILRYQAALEASPEDLIGAVKHIGAWWNPAHTYSGDADNLSMALAPGACFCERLADGSVFEHGAVHEYDAATGVLIHAALGPLHGKAERADWSIGWTGSDGGRGLVMTYVVQGPGLGALAGPVDQVMGEQFQRLVHFVEYGEPPPEPGV